MRKVKVIIKRVDKSTPYTTWISPTLKNLQNFVGGYIETVTIASDAVIICNEEGRIKGLPYNCTLLDHDFVGDLILIGADGDEFTDWPWSLEHTKKFFPQLWGLKK